MARISITIEDCDDGVIIVADPQIPEIVALLRSPDTVTPAQRLGAKACQAIAVESTRIVSGKPMQ